MSPWPRTVHLESPEAGWRFFDAIRGSLAPAGGGQGPAERRGETRNLLSNSQGLGPPQTYRCSGSTIRRFSASLTRSTQGSGVQPLAQPLRLSCRCGCMGSTQNRAPGHQPAFSSRRPSPLRWDPQGARQSTVLRSVQQLTSPGGDGLAAHLDLATFGAADSLGSASPLEALDGVSSPVRRSTPQAQR